MAPLWGSQESSNMANIAPAQLDNQEAQQQLSNTRWESTDPPQPRPWEEATATVKLFECSRIKALAGRPPLPHLGSSDRERIWPIGRGTKTELGEGTSPLKWCSQWGFK